MFKTVISNSARARRVLRYRHCKIRSTVLQYVTIPNVFSTKNASACPSACYYVVLLNTNLIFFILGNDVMIRDESLAYLPL